MNTELKGRPLIEEQELTLQVTIVHRYFWPENIAVLPLMFKDVVNLHLDAGHSVRVVCGSSKDQSKQWQEAFDGRVDVSFFQSTLDRHGSKLKRIFNMFRLASLALKNITGVKKQQLVYLVSYPPLMAGTVIFFSSLFNRQTKFVYYLQDNHTYLLKNKTLKAIFRAYHRYVVSRSSATITLSESMKEGIAECFDDRRKEEIVDRIHVVENYSTETASDVRFDEEKQFDIIYAGNHGVAQNLFYFFTLLEMLESDQPLKVVFYGDGTAKPELIEYCKKHKLRVDFRDSVGREQIVQEIAKAKFGLVAAQPGLMKYAHPSKLAAYNSAGTKALVMCEADSALNEWLEMNNVGIGIDPVNSNLAVQQLQNALSNFSAYSGSEVRDSVKSLYGKDIYLSKLSNVLKFVEGNK